MQDVYIEPQYHRNKNPFKSANFSVSYCIISQCIERKRIITKTSKTKDVESTEYLFIEWKHHSIVIGAGPATRWFTNRHNSG